jgi:gamma-glutamyl-gamma-aminobutyrate hydrolase PuuD
MIKAPKVLVAPPYGELEKQMYREWLIEHGFRPYFLGSECKNIDAPLILCGGADIGKNPIRDARECGWITSALENEQPIIGICRGMQLLNHYFGEPVENIPEPLLENHLNDTFDDDEDHSYRLSQFHQVYDIDGNLMEVNSRHHQHCRWVSLNFEITHRAEDGTVEGIVDYKRNIWAVQWHPERGECQDNEYPLDKLLT